MITGEDWKARASWPPEARIEINYSIEEKKPIKAFDVYEKKDCCLIEIFKRCCSATEDCLF